MRESAYPTHTLPPESTPGATPENQKVFYQRPIASGAPFVQKVSFDQWYARENPPPGSFGGPSAGQRQPKPVVDVLDLGPFAWGEEAPARESESVVFAV